MGKRIMMVPCYFQRCLEPVNTLISEWCSEGRHSRPLSERIISEIFRLGHSSFFSKCSKFYGHFRNGTKNPEKIFRFWDKAFEVVGENSAYCSRNTFHRQSMCWQRVLRFMIRVKQSFRNSIHLKFIGKKGNSGALLLSAVFRTS